jgi:osmotically-inducible protein OsmY
LVVGDMLSHVSLSLTQWAMLTLPPALLLAAEEARKLLVRWLIAGAKALRVLSRGYWYVDCCLSSTGDAPMQMTDSDIQQAVLRELERDPLIRATDIGVVVNRSVVMLTGVVDTWDEKRAAQNAAHRVPEVLDVANDLEVATSGATDRVDAELARAVRQALEGDVHVPHERIRTTVNHSIVMLEGTVGSSFDRDAAEEAIRYLHGIGGIANRLEVSPPKVADNDPQHRLKPSLEPSHSS